MERTDALWSGKPFDRWRARLDLLGEAANSPYVNHLAGRKISLQRGEIVASVAYLANRWGWGGGEVRGFLQMLVMDKFMISVRRTYGGTVYRIVDYDAWKGAQPAPRLEIPKSSAPGPPPKDGASAAVRAEWEERVIQRAKDQLPVIPDKLRTPAFEAAWRERLIERAEKLSAGKLSFTQVAGQFKKLLVVADRLGVDQAVACVQRATEGGYRGVVFKNDLETPVDEARGQLRQATLFGPVEDEPRVVDDEEVV